MLFRVLKKSFDILWQNSVIIQPFILFMFLISILLGSVNNLKGGFNPLLVLFGVSIFSLCGAFLAGWFQLFQAAIRNHSKNITSPTERAELSLASFREFLPAVGRFFVPITIAMFLYIVLFFGVMKLIVFLGMKYIGLSHNLAPERLIMLFSDKTKVYEFVSALTEADRHQLLKWDLLALFLTGTFSFVTMFWFQAIMLNGENAFKAFVSGVKGVFSKPFVTFGIFSLYWAASLVTSLITSLAPGMFLLQLLNLMLVVFITVYFIMVNFVYFEEYSGTNIAGWTNIFR